MNGWHQDAQAAAEVSALLAYPECPLQQLRWASRHDCELWKRPHLPPGTSEIRPPEEAFNVQNFVLYREGRGQPD